MKAPELGLKMVAPINKALATDTLLRQVIIYVKGSS